MEWNEFAWISTRVCVCVCVLEICFVYWQMIDYEYWQWFILFHGFMTHFPSREISIKTRDLVVCATSHDSIVVVVGFSGVKPKSMRRPMLFLHICKTLRSRFFLDFAYTNFTLYELKSLFRFLSTSLFLKFCVRVHHSD